MQEAEVLIRFPDMTEEKRQHVYKAATELGKAGISFDSGRTDGYNDWEFDRSLKGASVFFKRFKNENS